MSNDSLDAGTVSSLRIVAPCAVSAWAAPVQGFRCPSRPRRLGSSPA